MTQKKPQKKSQKTGKKKTRKKTAEKYDISRLCFEVRELRLAVQELRNQVLILREEVGEVPSKVWTNPWPTSPSPLNPFWWQPYPVSPTVPNDWTVPSDWTVTYGPHLETSNKIVVSNPNADLRKLANEKEE